MAGYLILPDGREVAARDGLVLGRVTGCDVIVNDTKASRRHAALRVTGSVVEIEDLESSNGTLLNGKKVQRRLLRDGDRIQIGAWAISYREGAVPTASAPAPSADLMFDDEPEPPRAPAPVAPSRPTSSPAPRPAPAPGPPASPAPASRPAADEIEFLDEVVQLRSAAPPVASGASRGASVPAPPARQRGVLQFHKTADRRGLLGDDLDQMSGWQRAGLWLLALTVAGVGGYVAWRLAS